MSICLCNNLRAVIPIHHLQYIGKYLLKILFFLLVFNCYIDSLIIFNLITENKYAEWHRAAINIGTLKFRKFYFKRIFIVILFLPLSYISSIIRLGILNEFCPLGTNIVVYLIANIVFTFLILFILLIIFISLNERYSKELENLLYPYTLTIPLFLQQFANIILPKRFSVSMLCLNFRVLYGMIAPVGLILVIVNAILKTKQPIVYSVHLLLIFTDLIIFVALKYPLHLLTQFQINFVILQLA